MPDKERKRIIGLLHQYYHDFGPTLAAEKLEERHRIKRDKNTIRAIMIDEGLWRLKQKKTSGMEAKKGQPRGNDPIRRLI